MPRRERRELQKKLREMEFQLWDIEMAQSERSPLTPIWEGEVSPWARERREILKRFLDMYDSRELERKAEKYGIEIPARADWYSSGIMFPDPADVSGEPVIDRWLNETGRTILSKLIRAERFSYWKGWADILIPILALIVAALALFKDIIVEVLKNA